MGGDHKCPVCDATFTRPQHVARHMRSHTGDRPYKCRYCTDQFARSDLMSRHVNKCHSDEDIPVGGTTNGRRSRATTSKQSCDQCVRSSLACDGAKPCARCAQRKTRCTFVEFNRQTAPTGPGHDPSEGEHGSCSSSSSSIHYPLYHPSPALLSDVYGREHERLSVKDMTGPGVSLDMLYSNSTTGQSVGGVRGWMGTDAGHGTGAGVYGETSPVWNQTFFDHTADKDLQQYMASISNRRRGSFDLGGSSGAGSLSSSVSSSTGSSFLRTSDEPTSVHVQQSFNHPHSYLPTHVDVNPHAHAQTQNQNQLLPQAQQSPIDTDARINTAFGVLSIHDPDAAPFFSHLQPVSRPEMTLHPEFGPHDHDHEHESQMSHETHISIPPVPPIPIAHVDSVGSSAGSADGHVGASDMDVHPHIEMSATPMTREDVWAQYIASGAEEATPAAHDMAAASGAPAPIPLSPGTRRRAASMFSVRTPLPGMLDTFWRNDHEEMVVGLRGYPVAAGLEDVNMQNHQQQFRDQGVEAEMQAQAHLHPHRPLHLPHIHSPSHHHDSINPTQEPSHYTVVRPPALSEDLSSWSTKLQSQRPPELHLGPTAKAKMNARSRRLTVSGDGRMTGAGVANMMPQNVGHQRPKVVVPQVGMDSRVLGGEGGGTVSPVDPGRRSCSSSSWSGSDLGTRTGTGRSVTRPKFKRLPSSTPLELENGRKKKRVHVQVGGVPKGQADEDVDHDVGVGVGIGDADNLMPKIESGESSPLLSVATAIAAASATATANAKEMMKKGSSERVVNLAQRRRSLRTDGESEFRLAKMPEMGFGV